MLVMLNLKDQNLKILTAVEIQMMVNIRRSHYQLWWSIFENFMSKVVEQNNTEYQTYTEFRL